MAELPRGISEREIRQHLAEDERSRLATMLADRRSVVVGVGTAFVGAAGLSALGVASAGRPVLQGWHPVLVVAAAALAVMLANAAPFHRRIKQETRRQLLSSDWARQEAESGRRHTNRRIWRHLTDKERADAYWGGAVGWWTWRAVWSAPATFVAVVALEALHLHYSAYSVSVVAIPLLIALSILFARAMARQRELIREFLASTQWAGDRRREAIHEFLFSTQGGEDQTGATGSAQR